MALFADFRHRQHFLYMVDITHAAIWLFRHTTIFVVNSAILILIAGGTAFLNSRNNIDLSKVVLKSNPLAGCLSCLSHSSLHEDEDEPKVSLSLDPNLCHGR